MTEKHSPLDQFIIKKLVNIELFGFDLSITNSSMAMIISTLAILVFFHFATSTASIIPGKMQVSAELVFSMIRNMLIQSAGEKSLSFVPFVITIFLFILFSNLFGMIPYGFTSTSQIAVTFFVSMIVFLLVIIFGLKNLGSHFFGIFLPKGIPLILNPLILVIEIFAFLAKPVTLSLRLTANMVGGHVLLKVLAGFMISVPFVAKIFPFGLGVIITGFEIFVALLQAYIFTILSCVYLADAFKEH